MMANRFRIKDTSSKKSIPAEPENVQEVWMQVALRYEDLVPMPLR